MKNDTIEFEAHSMEECTAKMNELCNDGRCWTAWEVFGHTHATAHAAPNNVPRTPAGREGELDTHYWQSGAWHKRRPATAAMERKQQQAADRAGGVSDGAGVSDNQAVAAWFRRRKRQGK